MTTPSTFDADTMKSAQPVPSAQSDQQTAQQVPAKFDAATMQTAQPVQQAPAKFDATTMSGAQPIQSQATSTQTAPNPAADAAMAAVKDAAGAGAQPGILTKLKNWAFKDIIPSDAVAKVATALVGAGQPVYDEHGNVRFYRGLTNAQLKEALIDPATHGDMSNVVNVPGAGLFDVGVLDAGIVNSASGNISGMTKPAMIATFGAGHVARTLGAARELFLGEEGLQTAAKELEGAEAVHNAAQSDVQAALAQTQKAEQIVKTAEQALAEGKTTEAAVAQARNVWSEQATNLRKAQQAVADAAKAKSVAASTVDKVVDNIHRISTTARGTVGRAVGTAGEAVEAGQQVAGKGMIAGMVPDIVEGRRENETPMDALERRATALGWSLMGGAELGAESKSDLMNRPISEIPESLRKDVQRVRDWANERAENKAALQQAISVEKIKQAVPSKGRTQYTAEDMDRALAHAEEAKKGGEPITNLTEFRNAVEEGRQSIEDNLAEKAEPYKDEPVVSKPEDSVKNKVAQKLDEMAKVDGNFAGAMDSLAEFNITDPTVGDTIELIAKLNNYQRAAMKGANNFDIHQMIETDPRFAARFFLADELRNALHNNLEGHGVEGSREARLETASLARVRDALGAQINANRGGTAVRGTGASNALQGVVAKLVGSGIRGAAVASGAAVAGPAGAVAGGAIGEPIAQKAENAISPRNKTRDSLIEEAFKNETTNRKPAKITGTGTPSTGPAVESIPPAPKPVEVTAPKVERENSELHAELVAHFPELTKLDEVPYQQLEARLRAEQGELGAKIARGETLTPAEKEKFSEGKKLLVKVLKNDAADAKAEAQAKKTAEEKSNAVQAEKTPEQKLKEEQQKAEQVAKGERPVELNPVLVALGRGDESGLVDHTVARKANVPATVITGLPEGLTSRDAHTEELAHLAVDALTGDQPFGIEIYSDKHPNMDEGAAAAAAFSKTKRVASYTNPDGSINPEKFKAALDQFVTRNMAGPATREVFNGWSKEDAMASEGNKSDIDNARAAVQEAYPDWSKKQIDDYLDAAYEHARGLLTLPHVADRIKANAEVREAGLPDTLHASRERVENFQRGLREAHDAYTGRGNPEPSTTGAGKGRKKAAPSAAEGQENAGAGAGGRGQEPRGGNAENERVGREVKGEEKSPINAAEEEGEEPLLMNELQTPRKMKYDVNVAEGGQLHKESVEAFSHKKALAAAEKAFPNANSVEVLNPQPIPGEEGYTVPTKPHLSTPTAKAGEPKIQRTMRHELGHFMVGYNEGIEAAGVLRHTHPVMGGNSNAAVDWNTGSLVDYTKFRPEARPAILRMLMGGVAADEVFSSIPRDQNENFNAVNIPSSDGGMAHRILRTAGFDYDTRNAMINKAVDDAKEHLTKPEVSGVIQENADVREPNLSTQYHFSPERLKAMGDEAARRLGEANEGTNQGPHDNGGVGASAAERGRGNVAGREGEGARANAEGIRAQEVRALPPQPKLPDAGTYAAIKTDDGAIYPDLQPEKQRTHIMLAKDLGIPAERIVSGGWLTNGEYEGSERSDAGRWGEQARAQQRVQENRETRVPPRRSTGKPEVDEAIEKGGGIPGGTIKGFDYPDKGTGETKHYGDSHIFHDPQTGTSLGFAPDEEVSAEAVQRKLADSRKAYGIKPEKAAVNHHEVLKNIKQAYGVHDDPEMTGDAGFITPDARFIDLKGSVTHQEAIENHGGEKVADVADNRRNFINETGSIRMRATRERAGNVLSFSVPKDGVSPEQATAMERSVGANADRNGVLRIERADVGPETKNELTTEKDFPRTSDVKPMLQKIGAIEQANLSYGPMKGLKEANESQAAAAKDSAHHENDLEWQDKHGATAEQLKAHEAEGGSTFSANGENLAGKNLYSVGEHPDRTREFDALTPEILNKYKADNADLLKDGQHAVGTWKDPDTGKHVLDIPKLHTDRDTATAAGTKANQKGIFHLGGEGYIPTGGTGEAVPAVEKSSLKKGPKEVDGEEVVQHLMKTANESHDDAMGRTKTYGAGKYTLTNVPINEGHVFAGDDYNPTLAKKYAEMKTPLPAIVLGPDGEVVDGNHRIAAAEIRGDKTVKAYVPQGYGLLPNEQTEKANLVKGSSVPLMNQPLDVKPGEGREEPNTLDVTKALNQFSRKANPALEPGSDPKLMTDRAKRIAADEAKYQLAQSKTGTEWYTTEMKDHDKEITNMRPELLTGPKTSVETPWEHTAKMTLFKAAEAVLSSGQKPYANVKSAIRAWDLYKETGEFPPVNPETGKSWGPRNINAYGNAFGAMNRLIKEKGEVGAANWLLSEHPVSELRQYNKAVAGKMSDTNTGAMILGEKRGPFMQNLHGIESKFTADMWVSRSWNRWMGTLDLDPRIEDKGKVTSESDAPRNNTERTLMKESFAHTADKLGLSTSSLQAVLWYYEQALYRAHGLPVESWSFSDAAKRVGAEKAAAEGQTDFKFGANEGEPETVSGVPKPAGKTKGGAISAFDLMNAFKGNK